MTYYRVKEECDNRPKVLKLKGSLKLSGDILVGGELYTTKERKRLLNPDSMFEKVEIPKSKVYWFFGARFAEEV